MLLFCRHLSGVGYSLSIAIVVLLKKNKYHFEDLATHRFPTLLLCNGTENTNYFDSIKMVMLLFYWN